MRLSRMLLAFAALLAVAGCGGFLGGHSRAPLTRAQLLTLLKKGMGLSQTAPHPGGAARTTRKHTGARITRQAPEFDRDHQWFDTTFQLWAAQLLDGGTDTYYFEDEALTLPAGSDTTVEDATHLFGLLRHREILAGPHKGDVLDVLYFLHDGGGGQEDAVGKSVDGKYEWHATWPADGLTSYTERWDLTDGSWFTFTNGPGDNGTHHVTMASSTGLKADWRFEGDLSGAATITGPGAGLPATMTWDATGNGEIVWSDGAREPYNVWS